MMWQLKPERQNGLGLAEAIQQMLEWENAMHVSRFDRPLPLNKVGQLVAELVLEPVSPEKPAARSGKQPR